MATIKIKRTATANPALNTLPYGELGIAANVLYYGNSGNDPIALVDIPSAQIITGSKRFQNDLNQFGIPTTNNEAEIVVDTGNVGSPQIGFTEHGDMSWAIGGDDSDNSFKIHGVATGVIPTINGLVTPHFEIDTTGNMTVQKKVYLTANVYLEYNSVDDALDVIFV